MKEPHVYFSKITEGAIFPTIATDGSVGYDLYTSEDVYIDSGNVVLVGTGIVAVPPDGYHFELVLRSSTPKKHKGLVLANSIGIIDSDYVGQKDEIKIMLLNTTPKMFFIKSSIYIPKHQKIAQLLLRENIVFPSYELPMENLGKSRGGFGHSDLKI